MAQKLISLSILIVILISCNNPEHEILIDKDDAKIAFGSCSNQVIEEQMWGEINANKPDVWVWGGDAVYSDTDDPEFMKKQYAIQKSNAGYQKLIHQTKVIGTWDDHDYGVNDGGKENPIKYESKELFLDFLDVPKDDIQRKRDGVYSSYDLEYNTGTIKVILLDARFFRTELSPDPSGEKRYLESKSPEGTMLGKAQWKWLNNELNTSEANFNIIVSGIQILSNKHGFECWGNMPYERTKLLKTIAKSGAKGVFILSGDRHVCEVSRIKEDYMPYPIYDITSSGLSHSYEDVGEEENPYRISDLIGKKNFTILDFNFKTNSVKVSIKGKNNKLLITEILKF